MQRLGSKNAHEGWEPVVSQILSGKDRKELVLLLWLICSGIPCHTLKSARWKDVKDEFGLQLSEAKSLWKFLPLLRTVALEAEEKILCSLSSFVTSLDLWTSKAGSHYLVVNYHGITPDEKFQMWQGTLDLIPFSCGAYASVLHCVVRSAIDRHTGGNPTIIHAGNVSDQGANVKLAGVLLTNKEDQMSCFNHTLKLIISDVLGALPGECGTAVDASKDFIGLTALVQLYRSHAPIRSTFADKEGDLQLVADNATRWEGKYQALKRFLQLQDVIRSTAKANKKDVQQLAENLAGSCPSNFLAKVYFKRLTDMLDILKPFHLISKKAQSPMEPTGSCVIRWTSSLIQHCTIDENNDSARLQSLKSCFLKSLQTRAGKYLTEVTTYLKCSLLDPRHAGKLLSYGVSPEVIDDAWNELLISCEDLYGDDYKQNVQLFRATLLSLRTLLEQSTSSDPLLYWRSPSEGGVRHSPLFQSVITRLRPLAAMYLAFPCGESSCERDFSYTGRIVSKLRTSLSDSALEDMLIVRNWANKPSYEKTLLFKHVETLMLQRKNVK